MADVMTAQTASQFRADAKERLRTLLADQAQVAELGAEPSLRQTQMYQQHGIFGRMGVHGITFNEEDLQKLLGILGG